jgi:hypothetical protein
MMVEIGQDFGELGGAEAMVINVLHQPQPGGGALQLLQFFVGDLAQINQQGGELLGEQAAGIGQHVLQAQGVGIGLPTGVEHQGEDDGQRLARVLPQPLVPDFDAALRQADGQAEIGARLVFDLQGDQG